MNVSQKTRGRFRPWATKLVLALYLGGSVASLFGTYWDDAWHTDVGRDGFFAAPHLVLYAGVLLSLAAVAWWLAAEHRAGVPPSPAARIGLAGGVVTLLAGPVDEAWHAAFGRDAVVWSPPHLLGVAGVLCLSAAMVAGLPRLWPRAGALRRGAVLAALLGAALVPVMEYEADVPQFAALWLTPVLTTGLAYAFAVGERLLGPARGVATAAALIYTALRLAVAGGLAAMDHSVVAVPLILPAALAFDATTRWPAAWRAAALAGTTALGVAVADALWAPLHVPAGALLGGFPLAVAAAWWTLRLAAPVTARRRRKPAPAPLALVCLAVLWPHPALAHDPGQGPERHPVTLTTQPGAPLRLDVDAPGCGAIQPRRVIARRAGQEVTGPLAEAGPCHFTGRVALPGPGRWFVYAEFTEGADPLEAWLAVERGAGTETRRHTVLYTPAGAAPRIGVRNAAGVLLLLAVAALARLPLRQARLTTP